jgi:hypothetical protein
LLQQLHHLGIDRRNLRALPLLPLVEVAWADGRIQDAERGYIEQKAVEHKLSEEDRLMLGNWFSHQPSLGYTQSAHTALSWLRRHGDPALSPTMLTSVVDDARKVAEAAGGLLGFGRVCRAEREALARLATELDSPPPALLREERHPDFGRKNPLVTLAQSPGACDEGEAVLAPLFGGPARLHIPDSGMDIGSSAETHLRIEGDPGVIARHCQIELRSGGFYVCGSGPLWVNGERVLERRLLGGETIRLSDAVSFVFKFVRTWRS